MILFSLKSVESLENGLQSHSGATPLFSMRTGSQVSLQSCCSVDADAWCKWALIQPSRSYVEDKTSHLAYAKQAVSHTRDQLQTNAKSDTSTKLRNCWGMVWQGVVGVMGGVGR